MLVIRGAVSDKSGDLSLSSTSLLVLTPLFDLYDRRRGSRSLFILARTISQARNDSTTLSPRLSTLSTLNRTTYTLLSVVIHGLTIYMSSLGKYSTFPSPSNSISVPISYS